jgi:molybdenum cofactor biosynthesis enzyme MoaA
MVLPDDRVEVDGRHEGLGLLDHRSRGGEEAPVYATPGHDGLGEHRRHLGLRLPTVSISSMRRAFVCSQMSRIRVSFDGKPRPRTAEGAGGNNT